MPEALPPADVLCAGLVCVDVVLGVPRHPAPDEKLRADYRLLAPGGPAAVASAQVARLGGRAAFAGMIGNPSRDPLAALLRAAFSEAGIDTAALVSVEGFETPLATVLVKPDAYRSVVSHHHVARSFCQSMIDETRLDFPVFPSARVVLVDGHRPEWSDTLVAHAHTLGAPLVLDAGSWTDSIRALAPRAGHLVASEACARAALGGDDPAGKEPAALRRALLARDDAFVVVTLGPRGLVWSSTSLSGTQPAFCIDALDTTGAGDAFHGAYALGLARGLEAEERLRLASAAGALACTRPGAWPSLAGVREIADLLALP